MLTYPFFVHEQNKKQKKTHTHKWKVVVGFMSNLSVKKKKLFIGGGCYIQCDTTLCFIYKLTIAIMKTQCVLSLFIYVLSLPPHDNHLLGKIINFVTWNICCAEYSFLTLSPNYFQPCHLISHMDIYKNKRNLLKNLKASRNIIFNF